MDTVNIWDLSSIKNCSYVDNIDELEKLINEGKFSHFVIRDLYICGDEPKNYLEEMMYYKGCSLRYVDDKRPVLVSSNFILPNIISKEFYKKYSKRINDAIINSLLNTDESFVIIPSSIYSSSLLDKLIKRGIKSFLFEDVILPKKDIEKLKNNFIQASVSINGEKEVISSRYIISFYTLEDIKEKDELLIDSEELDNIDLSNIGNLLEDKTIVVNNNSFSDMNEEEYYKDIKDFINKVDKEGIKLKISFRVIHRSIFNRIFNKEKFNNVELIIDNDLYDYSYQEYLDEEEILDNLVKPIIEADLSPLERFLAVYNIVKNFKPYKENVDNLEESRFIRYILNNDYMVCSGFAKLLMILCDRVGISTNDYDLRVDLSYDNGYTQEEIPVNLERHARVIVTIDDPKYDVHGINISDPTWDNDLSNNYLNHALIPFDKAVTENRMINLDTYSPLLDIHSFEEYIDQINFYLERAIRKNSKNKPNNIDRDKTKNKNDIILNSYNELINEILVAIESDPRISEFKKKLKNCKVENDYTNLLTELGYYLLTRINQPISNETIIRASVNAEAKIKGLSEEEKEKLYSETRKQFYDVELKTFPYQIDLASTHEWKLR